MNETRGTLGMELHLTIAVTCWITHSNHTCRHVPWRSGTSWWVHPPSCPRACCAYIDTISFERFMRSQCKTGYLQLWKGKDDVADVGRRDENQWWSRPSVVRETTGRRQGVHSMLHPDTESTRGLYKYLVLDWSAAQWGVETDVSMCVHIRMHEVPQPVSINFQLDKEGKWSGIVLIAQRW